MAISEYTRGAVVQVKGTVTNSGGTAVDPGTVKAYWRDPSGNQGTLTYLTDAALVKEATGIYYWNISGSVSGIWDARLEGTGNNSCAGEVSFKIKPSKF